MSKLPRWFWYVTAVAHVAVTIYIYPQTALDLQPSSPYELEPGVIGTVVVATIRALPYSIVTCIVIHFLSFSDRGKKVRDFLGQTVGLVFLVAIGIGMLSSLLSAGSCSSYSDQEYRAR